MKAIIGWTLFSAFLWFVAIGVATAIMAISPSQPVAILQESLLNWSPGLGRFISGPLSLAIVFYILFNTAQGMRIFEKIHFDPQTIFGGNVQAILAIVIIIAFAISAIGAVGQTSALKDVALVVVGFYFGSRKSQDTEEIAASAASAAGAAVAAQSTENKQLPESESR